MQSLRNTFRRLRTDLPQRLKRWHAHPIGFAVGVFLLLVVIGGLTLLTLIISHHSSTKLNSDTTHIAIVTHDGAQQLVPTRAKTVQELIQKLHISIGRNDRVEPSLDSQILQDNFRVNIYRASPVTIYDGSTITTAYTSATTARSAVMQAGLQVYPEDTIASAPATNIINQHSFGEVLTISRSDPVNLNLYGTQTAVRTHAKTVAGLLREKNVKLVGGATVTPVASTPITANMQIFILAKGVKIISSEETIAATVQKVDDDKLTLGSQAVRQAGSAGKQLVTYQITVDAAGKEASRKVIQTVVIQAPVTQIVAIGKNVAVPADKIAVMQAVGISPSDYGYVDYIVSHEGGWAGTTKYNKAGSGAYGICQALPGSKMASAGADWATNPVTQLKWCNGYALGRYGSWGGAYNFWLAKHYW